MERGLDEVTRACLDANIQATDQEAVNKKLLELPFNYFLLLNGQSITLTAA